MISHAYHDDPTDPTRALVNRLLDKRQPVLAMGPTGSGKTEHFKHRAQVMGLPFYQVQGRPTLTFEELVGGQQLNENGGAEFRLGPLALVMRDGGFLGLDEGPACEPGTLVALNEVANGGDLPITAGNKTIEVVKRHKDVVIGITGNPWQTYVGNQAFSPALVDRFFVAHWTYLKTEFESSVLHEAYPRLEIDLLTNLAELAKEQRAARHARRGSRYIITTRGLIQTAYLIDEMGMAPGEAIVSSLCSAAALFSHEEAEAIHNFASLRGFEGLPADLPAAA